MTDLPTTLRSAMSARGARLTEVAAEIGVSVRRLRAIRLSQTKPTDQEARAVSSWLGPLPEIGPQIQTVETVTRYADVSEAEFLVVGYRYKRGGAPEYYFPAEDFRDYRRDRDAGRLIVTQRDDYDRWAVLARRRAA